MRIDWPQALGWRLARHLLDPVGAKSVAQVVHTLCALPAQPETAAELAVRTRRQRSRRDEVERALAEGSVIKTYGFRGATHLMTPEDAGDYLALRAAGRMWELPSWQTFYNLAPDDWAILRDIVRTALADGPLPRAALAGAVTATREFRHLGKAFADGGDMLLKPLAWQGDLCFGPIQNGRATFQRLDANPRWRGLPALDDAGPRAVEAYFRAYAPAGPEHVHYWLGEGLGAGRKRIKGWLDGLGDRLVPVDVGGETRFVLRADLDELAAASPSKAVRLLPRYDQWVLGPGTADHRVVPSAIRPQISRGANVVIVGGVVAGTWSITEGEVRVAWSPEAGRPEPGALDDEIGRLAKIVGRPRRTGAQPG